MADPHAGPRTRRRLAARLRPTDVIWGTCLALCVLTLTLYGWHLRSRITDSAEEGPFASRQTHRPPPYSTAPLLVSYAFYEKDTIQRTNLEHFLQHGWVSPPGEVQPVTWVFVVTGDLCSPCVSAFPLTTPLQADPDMGITRAARVDGDPEDRHLHLTGSSSRRRPARPGGGVPQLLSGPHGAPEAGPTLLLWRSENVGMDLAAHNTSLEYLRRHGGGLSRYRYFLLLNSSVKGPYYPAYLPTWWHWTHAFLERFQPLPQGDPRWTYPPVLEVLPPGTPTGPYSRRRPMGPAVVRASWAVALDHVAMELVIRRGVLKVRTCKTCGDKEDGIIVGGEYGITSVLLEQAGYNVATLMSKYARCGRRLSPLPAYGRTCKGPCRDVLCGKGETLPVSAVGTVCGDRRVRVPCTPGPEKRRQGVPGADVDWRDERHWGCNDMVHPSRHGTYDGIAFHPYETIFVKSSWHVADPYTRRYSLWMTQHREGDAGTDGEWNEKLYHYAISPEAQMSNLLEAAYNVEKVRETLAKHREQEDKSLAEEQRVAEERAVSLNV
ncbi:hypothetical protein VOLCADRAFT_87431 [Volvox carteri f. nagariensis]|uniref:Uncharacterized protein n=1 Tax=Volvox carteri f. nagariensis TaxID=3068 RepID=D8TLB7_VOLCA|nr:uncharacterized protein VOLCADRAFT_87431 [Volvox carteri f. nagariensis]EFJ51845.1 hypothetical protein VOLCADRAFT_87431 [Volvox carteri f. nagariensis]|eukprot:XP_002947255.1 hypothetical protein VOLCADRAFT_87431 [Volvox carteri f. nagariensis]